jgi:hypothetical protein
MQVDFTKARRAIEQMLEEKLARFGQLYPGIRINKLTLWGLGFFKIAHVRLATSNDEAVFGDQFGEYNADEFGNPITFDEIWPDFYEKPEDEPYEILLANDKVLTTYPSEVGDEAIDKPFFSLLEEILRNSDLRRINMGSPLTLSVQVGNDYLEKTWCYDDRHKDA